MAFEELPADIEKFFETGELPESMKTAAPSPAAAPAPTPAPTPTPAAPATPDASTTAAIPSAQPAPNTDAYDRLLRLAEDQRKALEDKVKSLQGTVDKLTATPAPDPETDPLGFINHQMKQLQDQLTALTTGQKDAQTLQEQQTQQQQFIGTVNAQIKAFEANTPDYQDAYRHMIQMRTQDYLDSGMTATEAKAAVSNDELSIAARALQQGKNPAEIVYNMAKRYGYAKKDVPPTKEEGANKLDQIKKGLDASKTLDERGTPPAEPSIENLENMSDADLNKLVEQDWEKVFGKSKGIFG